MFCSLDRDALAARLAEWGELDHAVISRHDTPSGAEVRYRLDPAVAARLLDLIQSEAACCPVLTFDAGITLVVSG
jgi:hypothetical protein